MRRISLRSGVWLLAAAGVAVAVGVAAYPVVRLIPMVRGFRAATEPLQPLYSRLAEQGEWTEVTLRLAEHVVATDDAAALDSLRRQIGRHDVLTGALPLADVPDSVRLLVASSDEILSRFTAAIEEVLALRALGRRAEAVASLGRLAALEGEVRRLSSEAQVRGLDRVMAAERQVGGFAGVLVWLALVWLGGTVVVVTASLRFLRRRVVDPLDNLRAALERLRGGDLGVALTPVADDEIGGLVAEFNKMAAVLRARAEAQGQMSAAAELLAGAAHEVNNPLMAISGTVEEILASPDLPAGLRRDLDAVLAETQRAGTLLRGLVRFVRPAPSARVPVDLNDVGSDAVALMGSQFRADGIAVSLSLAPVVPPVCGDAQRLEHVVVSLLLNAHQALRQHGRGDGAVVVRTWVEDGRVRIGVSDDGPGVPADVLPMLFQPFATAREGGHVGLGLYSARLIARELRGDVTYEPPPAGGACFVVSLPVAAATTEAAASRPRPGEGTRAEARATLAGLRVLLVDDEALLRQSLARFLSRRGALVREAGDGAAALGRLAEGPCDAIVADLRMPKMDGIAFFRELRGTDPALAERLIVLSGDVGELARLDPSEVPAERVLAKPVKLAELEASLLRIGRR